MAFNMGDQFRGLPMGDLIGGPLMAAADAQVRLANTTAQFIQQVGFMPGKNTQPNPDGSVSYDPKTFDVRTVDFKFERPAGPADPKTGIVPTETVSLEVPMLAIVKIPSLAIDTVDIIFDMEVKNSESSKESEDTKGGFSADASVGWGPFSLKVHVEGSVATHKENTRSTDQSAKYHVEVHAADKGMPEGLARVLDMMNQAIAPKTIAPAAANGNDPQAGHALGPNPGSAPVLDHEAAPLPPGTYRVA
ncbi:MAG: DUF2589 domain-containing protein [Proteobacteria bacterium]|nr:DUF2589 domain-containing protein [Pseudomonadota bacterium]